MGDRKTKLIERLNPLILVGIGAATLFWILDILVDVRIFHEGEFVEQLFQPEPIELWFRSTMSGLILTFTIYVSVTTRKVRQGNSELARTLANYEEATAALKESEVKYHLLVEQIPAAIYVWELGDGGRCHYISPQIETMLGFSVGEWLNDPDLFFRQVHPEDQERAIAAENHSRDTGKPLHSEFRMLTREGRIIWVQDESFVLPNEPSQPRLNQGVLMDITERKRAEEELRRAKEALESANLELQQSLEREKMLACTDGLTGLYNHRHFFELADREFQAALRYQRSLAFLMFDMDDFKQVNDTLGHVAGDNLLARVAQTAVAQVRASDVVARYGGDEFIVMLPHASAQQALPIAERIRTGVAAIVVDIPKGPFNARLSVGIADVQHLPVDRNVEHVIQRADQALYQAKRMGRNRSVIFDENGKGAGDDQATN